MYANAPNTFRQNEIIFYALLAGQVFIGLVLRFALMQPDSGTAGEYGTIIPIAVAAGIALSFFFRKRAADTIPETGTPTEKINHYRLYFILQVAVLEGANLIALVLAFLDNNARALLWFALGVVAFLALRPNKAKFQADYNLSMAEMDEIGG